MRETPLKFREMRQSAVRASRLAGARVTTFGSGYVVAICAGLFLAFSGAFGTDALPIGPRLLYWVPTMLIGAAIGAVVSGLVATRAPAQSRIVTWAVITALISAPLTLVVAGYTSIMFGQTPRSLAFLGVAVLAVSAAMTAIMMLARPPTVMTDPAPGPAPMAAVGTAVGAPAVTPAFAPVFAPVFASRLPPKLMGGVLYALEAEDHYLRLHTSKGEDLILYRLADAIAELEGVDGAQTHRSWWVARAAVSEVRRTDGRVDLVLPSGAAAPVSRRNVRLLKELGWF